MIKIVLIILGVIVGLFVLFIICEFLLGLLDVILLGRVMGKIARHKAEVTEKFYETHETKYIRNEVILTVEDYIKLKNNYRNIVKEEVIHNWDDNKEFIKITYEYPITVRKRS